MRLFGRKDRGLTIIFHDSTRVVVRAGGILRNAVYDYQDLEAKMVKLTALEQKGDRLIQELLCQLNSSYILPLDREDVFNLLQKLLSILDAIMGTVDRMILYRPGRADLQVKEMADNLCDSLDILENAYYRLDKIERNNRKILECCNKIKKIEQCQDSLYRKGTAKLFQEHQNDLITLLKWQDIYESIEKAHNHVQDTTALLMNMCVKYS